MSGHPALLRSDPLPAFARRRPAGFTLVELLVVVAVIGILTAIALPVYTSVFRQSNQTVTLSNLRQIGQACLLYVSDHNNSLPNRAVANPDGTIPNKWPTLFQPYVPNLKVFVSPIPNVNGVSYNYTDMTTLLSNSQNNTSYITNGFNDLGAYTDASIAPRINLISQPDQVILFGIPYPQMHQFYMDFSEGLGNNNDVLNRTAFTVKSVYLFCDGSAQALQYVSTDNMAKPPTTGGRYTDWLWLANKTDSSIIQAPPGGTPYP